MFPIHIHDSEKKQLPEDDTFFIVAKEGPFIKKKVGVLECLVPVQNISILASAKDLVTSYARMHIRKIPKRDFIKVFDFLRAVYQEHRSEGMVLLMYDEVNNRHFQIAPKQKVSGAGVEYQRGYTREGYTMIGTIHSHANFSAFHSGTDHNDETSFDGLHITVGNVMDDDFSLSASIMANGHRVMVNPEEYISGIKLTVDVDEMEKRPTTRRFVWSKEEKKMVEDETQQNFTYVRRYDKRYRLVDPHENRVFPKFWLENVEHSYARWNYGGYGGSWRGGKWIPNSQNNSLWQDDDWFKTWTSGKDWGPGFNASWWDQKALPPTGQVTRVPPQNVGPVKTPGIKFPAHEIQNAQAEKEKVVKIMAWTIKQLFKYYDIWELDGDVAYFCKKCNIIYDWDEVDAFMKCDDCQGELTEVQLEPETSKTRDEETSDSGFTVKEVVETILSSFEAKSAKDVSESERSSNECPRCAAIMDDNDEMCPYCNTFVGKYSKEAEIEATAKVDSGEMLSKDAEEIEKEILRDAAKRDERTIPIPDPEKSTTPLAKHVQDTSRMSLKEMFKNVFGGKGK